MKRLILSTALAFAVAALTVAPAADAISAVPAAETSDLESQPSPDPAADTTAEGTDASADDSADGGGTDADAEGAETPEGEADAGITEDPEPAPDGEADAGVTEDPEPEAIDASLSLEKSTMTVAEVVDPGINYTVSGLKAGDVLQNASGETVDITEDGSYSGTLVAEEGPEPGDTIEVSVTVARGDDSETYTKTVTIAEDPGDEPTSSLSISPKSQQLSEFYENGVTIIMEGCHVDSEVTIQVSMKSDPDTVLWEETQVAGEDMAGAVTIAPDPDVDDGYGLVGEYLVSAWCGDQSQEGTFTVTANGSDTLQPTLSIDPERIPASDFIDRSKGVTLTVRSCEVGERVRFEVWNSGSRLYDRTVTAHELHSASVQVYGLTNDAGAYVGTYQVKATCGDEALAGEFVVTGSGAGSGGDGSGGSGSGGSMPRTGAELTGLTAGLALVAAGAGAILFARRKGRLQA